MSVLFSASRTMLRHVRIFAPGTGTQPGDPSKTPQVSTLGASDVGPNSFKLNYPTSSSASSYEYSLNGGPWLPMPANNTINGLSNLISYGVQVRGVNENGAGAASPSLTVTTSTLGLVWGQGSTVDGGRLFNGSLEFSGVTGRWESTYTSASFSKHTNIYAEFDIQVLNSSALIGLSTSNTQNGNLNGSFGPSFDPYRNNLMYTNPTTGQVETLNLSPYVTNPPDYVMIAWDGARFYVGRGGVWLNGDPATGTGGLVSAINGANLYVSAALATQNGYIRANFGAAPFQYVPPVGYENYQSSRALAGTITNTRALNLDQTSFNVMFDTDPYATSYQISTNHGPWRQIFPGDLISGLTQSTDYYYLIRGVNAYGYGPQTELRVKTAGPAPADMGIVSVSDVAPTTARLVFSDAPRADYYEYWSGQDGSFNDNVTWKRLPVDKIITDIYPNTTGVYDGAGYLQVAVRGVNTTGPGRYALSERFLPATTVPTQVTNVVVDNITSTAMRVTFTAAQFTTQPYQYRLNGGTWKTLPGNGIITGLTQNTNYSIQVAGVNGWGAGPASTSVAFKTSPVIMVWDTTWTTSGANLTGGNLTFNTTTDAWEKTAANKGFPTGARVYSEFSINTAAVNLRIGLTGDRSKMALLGGDTGPTFVPYTNVIYYVAFQGGSYQYVQLAPNRGAAADTIMMAWNGSRLFVGRNGSWINGDPASGSGGQDAYAPTPTLYFASVMASNGGSVTANFGTTAFRYGPPAGFIGPAAY